MPPRLPNELTELIIEQLALKPREECVQELLSCALVDSTLASICQRHIFHTVKLWIHVPVEGRPPSPETLELHRRALLFIRAVTQNPSLGLHVRCLSHYTTTAPSNDYDGLGDILGAFGAMPNIFDFELGNRISGALYVSGRGLLFDSGTRSTVAHKAVWKNAVLGIVARPSLGVLRFVNIERFPIGTLSAGIRELHLTRSWFVFRTGDREIITASPRRWIRVLSCDTRSLLRFVNIYLEALREGNPRPQNACVDLSRLERLSMFLRLSSREEYIPILSQATCLREVEFIVRRSITFYSQDVTLPSPPLHHVHPASRGTLSHLTVRHYISFGEDNMHLSSPYAHIVGEALGQLAALETLRFDIILQHFLELHPDTFTRGGWDHLSDVVTQPGACPRLEEVSIRVQIRALDTPLVYGYNEEGSVDRTVQECKEDAERLAGMFAEKVYPAMFLGMMQKRPEVRLSFVVEVSVGPELK